MDARERRELVQQYVQGASLRTIAANSTYGRESIRQILHIERVSFRGRGAKYDSPKKFDMRKRIYWAELLGNFYGDGSLSKNKTNKHGAYSANITFSYDEPDLVERCKTLYISLFGHEPRVVVGKGKRIVVFRRSVARHLAENSVPCGKKSVINPSEPCLQSSEEWQAFIRGFLNAEATVNNSVSVQQAVRMEGKRYETASLKPHTYLRYGYAYETVAWNDVQHLGKPPPSRILQSIARELAKLGIVSKTHPVRLYRGSTGVVSVHWELEFQRNA